MADYGIIVTDGTLVEKATKLQKILDKSKFLKAYKQDFFGLSITGSGTYTKDISHGLGYYPRFVHMGAVDPNFPQRRYPGKFAAQLGPNIIAIDSQITKDVLTIGWQDNSASPGLFRTYPYTVTFYYYIFYDKLE